MRLTNNSLRGLPEDVKFLISRYMKNNGRRTLQTLYKQTGISYTTLRRYASGDGSNFDLANILPLLDITADCEEQIVFLERYFTASANFMKKISSSFSKVESAPDMHELLKDFNHCLTYFLACCETGTTFKQLDTYNIPRMLDAAENMIELGYLEEVGGRLKAKYPELQFHDKELINTIIQHLTTMTALDGYRSGVHYYGLNDEARKKLLEWHGDFMEKAVDLMQDDKSKGDILVALGHLVIALHQDEDAKV